MESKKPFQNYVGGKSGAGVYQNIINHIPPHRLRIILFAGNCGVHRNIRPAEFHIINDLDTDVIKAWDATGLGLQVDYQFSSIDALEFLNDVFTKPEFVRQYKHTFIYLDPPYLFSSRRGQPPIYKHEFGLYSEHASLLYRLLDLSNNTGVKIMISHYPCELYDQMLADWNTHDFKAKTRHGLAIERIYYNYDLDGHLHDYTHIGTNFRQREAYNRQKKNLILKLDKMEPTLRFALLDEIELQYRNKNR